MTTATRTSDKALAERLADAYSTDNYRDGWAGCVRMLRRRGFDERQTEAIVRSKWTRWAADASNKPYGRNTSSDLARFLDRYGYTPQSKDVAEIVAGAFGVEAVATPAMILEARRMDAVYDRTPADEGFAAARTDARRAETLAAEVKAVATLTPAQVLEVLYEWRDEALKDDNAHAAAAFTVAIVRVKEAEKARVRR